MPVRIGFPAVPTQDDATTETNATAVWISSSPGSGAYWGNQRLRDRAPFGSNDALNEVMARLATDRMIRFECGSSGELSCEPERGEYFVRLGGVSFGLAVELLQHFWIPSVSSEDSAEHLSLLLSGCVDHELEPRGVGDQRELRAKGRLVAANRWGLVVLREDYEHLDAHSGNLFSPFIKQASLPETIGALRDAVALHGRAFILPVGPRGKWLGKAVSWWECLGKILGLERLTPSEFHSGSSPRSGAQPPAALLADGKGTIGSLYAQAFRSSAAKRYLSAFVDHNRGECSRLLFEDGLIAQALPQADRIFGTVAKPPGIFYPHIVIGGPTGCGKTFLAEAIMLNTAIDLRQPVLYVAPTRALAYERFQSLLARIPAGEPDAPILQSDIIVSTGEERQADWRLNRPDGYRIALLVNEKANLFLRAARGPLGHLGLVVIDELHMLADPNRGGILDMLIAKIRRENARRRTTDRPPVRLIAITTEDLALDERVATALAVPKGGRDVLGPVTLTATTRPVAVSHVFRLHGYLRKSDEVPVVSFSRQADRYLEDDRCEQVGDALLAAASQLRTRIPAREHKNLITTLADLVQEYAGEGYKSILVAHDNILELRELARQVKNARAKKGFHADNEEFRELQEHLTRGAVGRSVADDLLELARYGVYVHHADLPRAIREVVERHFRRNTVAAPYPEFLFATETLFYGVNLSADCVILTDVLWPRFVASEHSHQMDTKNLTSTEFHNILGRVGRPGFASEGTPPAKAVICLPIDRSEGDLATAVLRYYGKAPINPQIAKPLSALFAERDIERSQKGQMERLELVSYPTFRSVMDALRHVSDDGYSAASEVVSLFDQTLFWHTQQQPRDVITSVVEGVLGAAAAEGIVSHHSDGTVSKYKIKPQAEALIDTGTRWQSVRPMQEWLEALRGLKAAIDQREMPPELLVPAFVCSDDLWIPTRAFCWENGEKAPPAGDALARNEEEARRNLNGELNKLGLVGESAAAVEEALGAMLERAPLPLDVEEFRRAVFYRLVTAFLRWLRGADPDEISLLSLKDVPADNSRRQLKLRNEGRSFKGQHADRASWLAVACERYFRETGILLPEHLRELPRLARRLRMGVPSEGIPFAGETAGGLNRAEVRQLVDQGVTGSRILRSSNPAHLISLKAALPEGLRSGAEEIVDRVFAFYRNEIGDLVTVLRSPETEEALNAFQATMTYVFAEGRKSGQGVSRLSDAYRDELLAVLDALVQRSGEAGLIAAVEPDGTTLRLHEKRTGGATVRFGVALPGQHGARGGEEAAGTSVCVKFPWPDQEEGSCERVEVTGCGSLVLAELVGRKCVSLYQLDEWARARAGTVVSIKGLLEDLRPQTLPGELREAFLQLNEPGID